MIPNVPSSAAVYSDMIQTSSTDDERIEHIKLGEARETNAVPPEKTKSKEVQRNFVALVIFLGHTTGIATDDGRRIDFRGGWKRIDMTQTGSQPWLG